ncbi:hypothetical protein ACWEIJ_08990 [Lentzea sp. NPDC004789]
MEDLMKDLARVRPAVPEVDRDRMERDLARITALPRARSARTRLVRRFAPVLVVAGVIALVVVLLPRPTQPAQPAAPRPWWHALTQQWSLMVVGDPANPFVVMISSKTDQWLTVNRQVTVVQKDGWVQPFTSDDGIKWELTGKPATVPQVGGSHSVRMGPMKPSVQKTNVAGFQMSLHSKVRFDSFDSLPADPAELRKSLETISGKDTYKTATLAMEVMTANVRDDQRRAAFELLKSLDGARFLGEVPLSDGRSGIGVAIPAPSTFQFSGVETQFVVNPETGLPMVKRDMISTSQHGVPADFPISEEQYLLLDSTSIDPIVPQDVPVNGPVESPVVER